jgi:hypothetical protein
MEEAFKILDKERQQAKTFAMETFQHYVDKGVSPSIEKDGEVYLNSVVLDMMSGAVAQASLALAYANPGASNALGKVCSMLTAIVDEARGLPLKSTEELVQERGLL